MSFLARCPKCGEFQISVTSVENAVNLKCRRCGLVFTPVEEPVRAPDVNWSLAMTLCGHEFEPPRASSANLVVIQNLPSVYPKRHSTRRGPKRRRKRSSRKRFEAMLAPPVAPEVEAPSPAQSPAEVDLDNQTAPPTDRRVVETPAIAIPPVQCRPPLPKQFVRPTRKIDDDEDAEYGWLELNRTSIIALFLLVVGLLSASISALGVLFWPAIVLSVVVGAYSVRLSIAEGRRLLVPIASIVIAIITCVGSLLAPGQSGSKLPDWANEQLVIPHPRFASEPGVSTADWIDASKASIQLNGIRIEVVEARVARRPGSSESNLIVRIRIHQSGIPGTPSSQRYEINGAVLFAGAERFEQLALLNDSSAVGPGRKFADAVLAFSSTADHSSGLRLEVPSTSLGGTRPLRFLLPAAMIKR